MGKISRWAGRLSVVAIVLAIAFFLLRGCAFMPWNREEAAFSVRVTITRDFGNELLRDQWVEVKGSADAMQVLQKVAEVKTSYGGGFVEAIDGLASRYGKGLEGSSEKLDWFFYVNGQMAHLGAAAFPLNPGDWVVFDYHRWDYSLFTPALAGCFPEPFVHGYEGAPKNRRVLFAEGWEGEAEKLAKFLEEVGGGPCEVRKIDEAWVPKDGECVAVLGTWRELRGFPFLAQAYANAASLGLYAYFHGDELVVLDEWGKRRTSYSRGAGIVSCTGPRLGECGAVLLVSGTDREGVEGALRLLLELRNQQVPPSLILVCLANGEAIRVPVKEDVGDASRL